MQVGDQVHYVSFGTPGGEYGQQCRAAIVTEIIRKDDNGGNLRNVVSLAVLNPTGFFFNSPVFYDAGERNVPRTDMCLGLHYRGGTWHWARV